MQIHVDPNTSLIQVFSNSQLIGEITLSNVKTTSDLQEEVHQARLNSALSVWLKEVLTKAHDRVFMQGFIDGLNNETTPHPYSTPPLKGNYQGNAKDFPAYLRGYEIGNAIYAHVS